MREPASLDAPDAAALAEAGIEWLLSRAETDDPSLYHGLSGILLTLHEASVALAHDRCRRAVDLGADRLAGMVEELDDSSLHFGLAGAAFTLRALARDEAADLALARIRDRFDGTRWNDMFELLMGSRQVVRSVRMEATGAASACLTDPDAPDRPPAYSGTGSSPHLGSSLHDLSPARRLRSDCRRPVAFGSGGGWQPQRWR